MQGAIPDHARVTTSPQNLLKDVFGYRNFKGDQQAIIEAALDGRDSLVIMPTGGGKSLCYQIPAMLREGTGLVISPLIALMQDQVRALNEFGIAAEFLNSSQSFDEMQLRNGQTKAWRVTTAVCRAGAAQHRADTVLATRNSHLHDRD